MPLNATSDETVGQGKDHWEDLRENNVPRFLFRMFHWQSGGGPGVAINNATEIVPRGFMDGNKGSSVYGKTEKEMYKMVKDHFDDNKEVRTEFSSWAASLHAVLCFARDTCAGWNPHVAVIDRTRLEGEVLVWWVPDLLGAKQGDIEYLAHGCIRGRGYIAVPFEQLVTNGLYSLFPELGAWKKNRSKGMPFGLKLRKKMFDRAPPVDISTEDIATAKKNRHLIWRACSAGHGGAALSQAAGSYWIQRDGSSGD